jgi:hypothetical protein
VIENFLFQFRRRCDRRNRKSQRGAHPLKFGQLFCALLAAGLQMAFQLLALVVVQRA